MKHTTALWQGAALFGIASWIMLSSSLHLTQKLRSRFQPWAAKHVIAGTKIVLQIQNFRHRYLDTLFSGLSYVVSVPFYTAFLPLLFWSGHGKLARQMTLLMAFCDYLGNCMKDAVSAPRPCCPPVKRITATKDEQHNALEYGFPSSHTLNTVCLAGYLLNYIASCAPIEDISFELFGIAILCLFVGLVGVGRIYLGMHSLIDILSGFAFGLVILAFWLIVHDYVDNFIVSGENVTAFWAALSFLLLFAYPTPESPTPSFEYHTAFNGVAFGTVVGVHQTYSQFHHEAVPRIFTEFSPTVFVGRVFVGIPTMLVLKLCCKALANRVTSAASAAMAIPSRPNKCLPVDTVVRFVQYAGLAWSVVDLAPTLFSHLGL